MILRVFFLIFFVGKIGATVTTEDIRVAILQMVNVARNTDDKLERHEFREKQLGEQLKKGLINIDKRIKMLDPLKGTVGRMDERLAAIETILLQKDKEDRERQLQQQQIYNIVLDIQSRMPELIGQLNQDITEKIGMSVPPAAISEPMMTKKDFNKIEKQVVDKMDTVASTIRNMEEELVKIRSENLNSISDINNKSNEHLEKVKRQLDNSENLLAKFENKLAEYNRIPEMGGYDKVDQSLEALNTQKAQLLEVKQLLKDIPLVQNLTLTKLEEIQDRIPQSASVERTLTDLKETSNKNHEAVKSSFNELTEITTQLTLGFSKNYDNIRSEIQDFGKMGPVIMQTADSVLDTKRRLEYGILQIMGEMDKQMKASSSEITQGITERFEGFELTILDEEYGALHNLTSKIQDEIGNVWRQIGIMHQQMSASTDTLNKLQNQTDSYVNDSVDIMGSMKGKVTQITSRMTEMDENLNFLLGKLSLVSQEFNGVKSGLGATLDEIRSSFHKVQEKVKQDKGPGPHKISSAEAASN